MPLPRRITDIQQNNNAYSDPASISSISPKQDETFIEDYEEESLPQLEAFEDELPSFEIPITQEEHTFQNDDQETSNISNLKNLDENELDHLLGLDDIIVKPTSNNVMKNDTEDTFEIEETPQTITDNNNFDIVFDDEDNNGSSTIVKSESFNNDNENVNDEEEFTFTIEDDNEFLTHSGEKDAKTDEVLSDEDYKNIMFNLEEMDTISGEDEAVEDDADTNQNNVDANNVFSETDYANIMNKINSINFDDDGDNIESTDNNSHNELDEEWSFDEIFENNTKNDTIQNDNSDGEYREALKNILDEDFEHLIDENDEDSTTDDDYEWSFDDIPENNATIQSEEEEEEEEASEPEFFDKETEKTDSSLINTLKKKINSAKKKIAADLRGEDEPYDEEEEEENKSPEQPIKSEPKKTASGKKPNIKLPKILQPFKKLYMMIVGFLLSILTTILSLLSKVPFIGKIFKPILAATKILEKIALSFPIILVILVLVFINYRAVPHSTTIQLPDNGSVSFNKFDYDPSTGKVSGTAENTGEVIASDLNSRFVFYSLQPGLNPKSWVIPVEIGKCQGNTVSVDIESSVIVSGTCDDINKEGFFIRVKGELYE